MHKGGKLEAETGQKSKIKRVAGTAARETAKITWKQSGGKLCSLYVTVKPQEL